MLNSSSDFLNPAGSLYFGVLSDGWPGQRPAYATSSPAGLWIGMAMRPSKRPFLQKPRPNFLMVSSVSPRSARYGCAESRCWRLNVSGELAVLFSGSGSALDAGSGFGLRAGGWAVAFAGWFRRFDGEPFLNAQRRFADADAFLEA